MGIRVDDNDVEYCYGWALGKVRVIGQAIRDCRAERAQALPGQKECDAERTKLAKTISQAIEVACSEREKNPRHAKKCNCSTN